MRSLTRMGPAVLALAAAQAAPALADPYVEGLGSVETPSGLARVEGDWRYPDVERLVIGDATVVEPDPESAQQVVWIEARAGTLLLVGLGSVGNGCFTQYVWVHTAPEDALRATEPFGTCGGDLQVASDAETVTVSMDSLDPDEGRLEYVYDGRAVRERVLGMPESHSGPGARAGDWIGHAPGELFAASDWREPLVALMGEAAYQEAQEVFNLSDGEGMQLSEGWVAGMGYGNRGSSQAWGAVAIDDDDRRILVVLKAPGEAPRMWGEPRGPLPQPIVEAIARPR